MHPLHEPLRRASLAAATLAITPYVALKLAWIAGSEIGMTSGAEAAVMSDARFVVGNVITIGLMMVALGFVVALTRSWARRVPAWLVLVLGGGATGLLAPVLLGLPLGLLIQLAVGGRVEPGDDRGLDPWVFGVVYSGFGLLAVAISVLLGLYVVDRWGHLISAPPEPPSSVAIGVGALGLLPFGAAMAFWGIAGPGSTGPLGMDEPVQRTVLVVIGVLSVAAFGAPILGWRADRWPRATWLTTWVGCCIAALQGPAMILLARDGDVQPFVALTALLATPGSCVYGLGILRRRTSSPLVPVG
jgi:hypothetical protein